MLSLTKLNYKHMLDPHLQNQKLFFPLKMLEHMEDDNIQNPHDISGIYTLELAVKLLLNI